MIVIKGIERLALFLEKVGRKRIILDRTDQNVYMERYYLLFRERNRFCPFNVLLHRVLLSDPEGFHDHPWNWGSFILSGGYWEHTPEGKFWRGAGSLRFRNAESLHRLEIDRDKAKIDTWTLFFIGPRFREWGFIHSEFGWMQWKQYLDRLNDKECDRL